MSCSGAHWAGVVLVRQSVIEPGVVPSPMIGSVIGGPCAPISRQSERAANGLPRSTLAIVVDAGAATAAGGMGAVAAAMASAPDLRRMVRQLARRAAAFDLQGGGADRVARLQLGADFGQQ